MTQYPSTEEIKQIVARRKQLSQELISCLMLTGERERIDRLNHLVSRYGEAEVNSSWNFQSWTFSPNLCIFR